MRDAASSGILPISCDQHYNSDNNDVLSSLIIRMMPWIFCLFVIEKSSVYVCLLFQDDEEEELLKNMQDDVKWLKETIMPEFFMDLTDGQVDMIVKITEVKTFNCLKTMKWFANKGP